MLKIKFCKLYDSKMKSTAKLTHKNISWSHKAASGQYENYSIDGRFTGKVKELVDTLTCDGKTTVGIVGDFHSEYDKAKNTRNVYVMVTKLVVGDQVAELYPVTDEPEYTSLVIPYATLWDNNLPDTAKLIHKNASWGIKKADGTYDNQSIDARFAGKAKEALEALDLKPKETVRLSGRLCNSYNKEKNTEYTYLFVNEVSRVPARAAAAPAEVEDQVVADLDELVDPDDLPF